MTTPNLATETTADTADTADTACPPQTGRLHTSLQYLRNQIIQYDKRLPAHIHRKCKWAVDQFLRRLDVELELFNATLFDLADSYRAVDEADWRTVEQSIRMRCGEFYGQYLDLVNHMLATVRAIAELAGMAQDTAPWLQQRVRQGGDHTATTSPSIVLPRDSSWKIFITAICSVNGSLGGQVDVYLTNIWKANEKLIEIRRKVQETPSKVPSKQLEALRQHAERVANVLGQQNGFGCSHGSHGAFIQIKECFKDHEAGSDAQKWDEVCSFVFHNSSTDPTMPSSWIEMTAEIVSPQSSGQPDIEETRSSRKSSLNKSSLKKSSLKKSSLKKSQMETAVKTSFMKTIRFLGASATQDIDEDRRSDPTRSSSDAIIFSNPDDGLCSLLSSHISSEKVQKTNVVVLSRKNEKYQLRLDLVPSETGYNTWNQGPVSVRKRYSSSELPALSTEERLELAIKVTSSIFYLHSTPWLARSWNTEDIYLISEPGSEQLGGPLLAQSPDLQSCHEPPADQQTNDSTNMDTTISHLGRFLVELWCGAPWDCVRDTFLGSSIAHPQMESDVESLVITHILTWAADPTVAEKHRPFYLEGSSYADAVRSCFLRDFGQQTTSLEDEHFRLGVFSRILRPLQYALDDFHALQSRIYGSMKVLNDECSSHGSNRPQEMQDFMLFDDEDLGPDSQAKISSANKWFEAYADVNRIAQTIRQRPRSARDRIRVAVLDTGVDVSEHFLHKFWLKGQIMYENFAPGGSHSKLPQDNHGHGTYITSILLKIAKNVDVYVARVSEDGKMWNSSLVEEALQWAVKQDVHIISISFGFPRINQSLEPIRRGILQAHAADILVFAAASNAGKGHPIAFPACLDEVICVSSTDGAGQASLFNPNIQAGKRLCAIGEGIPGSWPLKLNPNGGTVRKAGTSYATPVVAGVVAMVMDCVWSIRGECSLEAQMLRTNRGILAVLALMLTKDKGIEFLSPGLLFNDAKNGTTVLSVEGNASLWQQGNGILVMIIGILKNVYG